MNNAKKTNNICSLCGSYYNKELKFFQLFPCKDTICEDCYNSITDQICPVCNKRIEYEENFDSLGSDNEEREEVEEGGEDHEDDCCGEE